VATVSDGGELVYLGGGGLGCNMEPYPCALLLQSSGYLFCSRLKQRDYWRTFTGSKGGVLGRSGARSTENIRVITRNFFSYTIAARKQDEEACAIIL